MNTLVITSGVGVTPRGAARSYAACDRNREATNLCLRSDGSQYLRTRCEFHEEAAEREMTNVMKDVRASTWSVRAVSARSRLEEDPRWGGGRLHVGRYCWT